MKRFHFSLRPLAVLRAHREERAREVFAAAASACAQSEADLLRTRDQVAAVERAVTSGRQGRFNPGSEVQAIEGYRRECALEVEAERRTVEARGVLQRDRAAYVDAHRKLEVLHRLEAQARTAHRLAASREEQAAFDDFAGRRHFVTKTSFAR